MIVAAIFGAIVYLLLLAVSIHLVFSGARDGDYDLAIGGLIIALILIGLAFAAFGV